MSDLFRLTDQAALVTGASSGIGAATAEVLAERGARVALGYHRNRTGAEETAARIRAAGGTAVTIGADVRVAADVTRLVREAAAALGPLDILVNNAGSLVERQKLAEVTAARWDDIYALNVRSVLLVSQAVVPLMLERRRGTQDVEISGVLRAGIPDEEICRLADELGADMIVIGTHARGAVARALLGSVAQRVVRASKVPVMTIRAPQRES